MDILAYYLIYIGHTKLLFLKVISSQENVSIIVGQGHTQGIGLCPIFSCIKNPNQV